MTCLDRRTVLEFACLNALSKVWICFFGYTPVYLIRMIKPTWHAHKSQWIFCTVSLLLQSPIFVWQEKVSIASKNNNVS